MFALAVWRNQDGGGSGAGEMLEPDSLPSPQERHIAMDATELAALTALAKREVWGADELPSDIGAELYMCLDEAGLIEVRHVIMANVGNDLPRKPIAENWFSLINNPETGVTWQRVLTQCKRDEVSHPYEVQVSSRGRVEVARMRRAAERGGSQDIPTPSGEPGAGVQPEVVYKGPMDDSILDRKRVHSGEPPEVRVSSRANVKGSRRNLIGQSIYQDEATPPVAKPGGWTKSELVEQADTSGTTFDRIRKAAKLKMSKKGGEGQQRRYSRAELRLLIVAVANGPFRGREEIALSWREMLPDDENVNHQ
jgi:hypothetical protein